MNQSKTDTLCAHILAFSLLGVLVACDQANHTAVPNSGVHGIPVPGGNPSNSNNDGSNVPIGQLVTHIDRDLMKAGEVLTVQCWENTENGLELPSSPVNIYLQPAPGYVAVQDAAAQVRLERAGDVIASCSSPAGLNSDPDGRRVTVEPGLPAVFSAELPPQACYRQDAPLPFAVEIEDIYGNAVDESALRLSAFPADILTLHEDGSYRFNREGSVKVTLSVAEPHEPGANLPEYIRDVYVDSTPPMIDVQSPQDLSMISTTSSAVQNISFQGTVSDASEVAPTVLINGEDTIALSGGSFSTTITSRMGLNVNTLVATDTCGNVAQRVINFVRAKDYLQATNVLSAGGRNSKALLMHLEQRVVDDGNRNDVDDIATIMETVADSVNIDAQIPAGTVFLSNPLYCPGWGSDTGYHVQRHPSASRKVLWDGIRVDALRFVKGGFEFDVSVEDFDFPLRAYAGSAQCWGVAPLVEEVTVDAWVGFDSVTVSGLIQAEANGSHINLELDSFNTNIVNAYIDLECGSLDNVCNGITGSIVGIAEGFAEDMITEAVMDAVNAKLEESMESLEIVSSMTLPAPISKTLNYDLRLDHLLMCGPNVGLTSQGSCPSGSNFAQLGASFQVLPGSRGQNIPFNAKGAPVMYPGAPPKPALNRDIAAMIDIDAVNQVLWATWYSGGLDIPNVQDVLGDSAPAELPEGIDMDIAVRLPPVLMPGSAQSFVELGFGALELSGTLPPGSLTSAGLGGTEPFEITLRASAVIGANLQMNSKNTQLLFSVVDENLFAVEVLEINGESGGNIGALSVALNNIIRNLMPSLSQKIIKAVPVPHLDLKKQALPVDGILSVKDVNFSTQAGYMVADGLIDMKGSWTLDPIVFNELPF